VRLRFSPASAAPSLELSRAGLKFPPVRNQQGREKLANGIPAVTSRTRCVRSMDGWSPKACANEIRLTVSGGIAMAEHMAKAIICGADLVGVDTALLVALGWPRLPRRPPPDADGRGELRELCPAETDPRLRYARRRMVEPHGAPGTAQFDRGSWAPWGNREVRRLRGEVGRAILHGRHREGGVRRPVPRASLTE